MENSETSTNPKKSKRILNNLKTKPRTSSLILFISSLSLIAMCHLCVCSSFSLSIAIAFLKRLHVLHFIFSFLLHFIKNLNPSFFIFMPNNWRFSSGFINSNLLLMLLIFCCCCRFLLLLSFKFFMFTIISI